MPRVQRHGLGLLAAALLTLGLYALHGAAVERVVDAVVDHIANPVGEAPTDGPRQADTEWVFSACVLLGSLVALRRSRRRHSAPWSRPTSRARVGRFAAPCAPTPALVPVILRR